MIRELHEARNWFFLEVGQYFSNTHFRRIVSFPPELLIHKDVEEDLLHPVSGVTVGGDVPVTSLVDLHLCDVLNVSWFGNLSLWEILSTLFSS